MRLPSRTTISWSGPRPHPPTDHPADLSLRSLHQREDDRSAATAPPPTPPGVRWPRDAAHQLDGRGIAAQLDGRAPSGCRSKGGTPRMSHSSRSRPRSVDTRSFRLTAARRRGSLFVTLSGASGRRSGCPFGPRPNGTSGTASARDVDQPLLRWRVAQRTPLRATHSSLVMAHIRASTALRRSVGGHRTLL
jgi:hypothetical protein